MVIIGDFNPNETRKMIRNLFYGEIVDYKVPEAKPNAESLEINFIDMPNAVQSNISLTSNVQLKMSDPDYHAVLIANKILGGGFNSYLNMNLREEHGYTYAARSSIGSSKYTKSRFRASTSTRFQVTDSAVVELLNEIKKIKTINVSDKELSDVKAKYVGNFVLSSESPSTIANYALNIKTQSLDKDFYKNYLSNINKVSKEDIIRVSKKYFQIDKGQIIITGKGSELINKLEKISFENKIIPILFFDKYGNQVEKPILNKKISKEVNVKTIFENYLNAIGGLDEINKIKSISTIATVKIQNAPFSPSCFSKQKHPNLL